jgi:hypothetical protein
VINQALLELRRRTDSQQLSIVKKSHPRTTIGFIHVVRGHEDRGSFLAELIKEIPNRLGAPLALACTEKGPVGPAGLGCGNQPIVVKPQKRWQKTRDFQEV